MYYPPDAIQYHVTLVCPSNSNISVSIRYERAFFHVSQPTCPIFTFQSVLCEVERVWWTPEYLFSVILGTAVGGDVVLAIEICFHLRKNGCHNNSSLYTLCNRRTVTRTVRADIAH